MGIRPESIFAAQAEAIVMLEYGTGGRVVTRRLAPEGQVIACAVVGKAGCTVGGYRNLLGLQRVCEILISSASQSLAVLETHEGRGTG
jgi:hypothetical protein